MYECCLITERLRTLLKHVSALPVADAFANHPALGALFETAVVGEVRLLSSVLSSKPALHQWRSYGGAEVDLPLERDGTLIPIEIKATARPTRNDVRGIAALRATYDREHCAAAGRYGHFQGVIL